jgi:glycosyltransferase involved in cell wall biosynthesis
MNEPESATGGSGLRRPTPEVSVVAPVYDEEENVLPLCRAIHDALDGWDRTYEIVLVDDGSRDRTREILLEQVEHDPRLRVFFMKRNAGQTAAMAAGFAQARGEIIVSMDGDMQNDPRDIPLLVSRIDAGHDVVCGWRKARKDAWLSRKLPSKIANRIIAWLTGVPIHDNGCSLKAYRAKVISSLNLYSDMHRFLPALSSMTGARIDEVVVRHHPRTRGTSKYGISRTFKVLSDMVTIKMLIQFADRPGKWFGYLALPWLLLGVLCGAAWLVGVWVLDAPASIVLPSASVLSIYLFGHMMVLSILSEVILAEADRRYLQLLADVLTSSEETGESTH